MRVEGRVMSAAKWPVVRNGFHRYELRLWMLELTSSVGTAGEGEDVQFFDVRDVEAFFLELMLDEENVQVLREFLAGEFGNLFPLALGDSNERHVAEFLAWSVSQKSLRVVRLQEPRRGGLGERGQGRVLVRSDRWDAGAEVDHGR